MKITSKSQLEENEKFSLNLFKEPFCSNELERSKRYETIKSFENKSTEEIVIEAVFLEVYFFTIKYFNGKSNKANKYIGFSKTIMRLIFD